MQLCPRTPIQVVLSLLLVLPLLIRGVIIPPSWANHTLNPCAPKSWQLLHWPQDKQCYNIFTQGPCEESQEIYFNENLGRAACRCSRGTLWHLDSKRCHKEYSKGPCRYKEYFALEATKGSDVVEEGKPRGACRKYEDCPPGHLFWPKTTKCFPHLSRGPCLQGHLLHIDPKTGSTACGCDAGFMSTNYWPHGDSCHELFTRGPCVQGHIFLYNLTLGATQCLCGPSLITNYHEGTDRCFELDTTGPCRVGQVFSYHPATNRAKCQCLDGYIEWPETGQCYRSYTRGPCPKGHFLRATNDRLGVGKCMKSACKHGELYDPGTEKCYPVGRRGPCTRGKLWVFERATSVQGSCHCDPHLIGYWEPHGVCYELGAKGPCPKRRVLAYERQTGNLMCRCDIRRGFVPWANSRCIKAGVRRDKLIPVAGPIETSERGNLIPTERVHRGLTLPELGKKNASHPIKRKPNNIPPHLQKEILNDILHTIHNVSLTQSRSSTSVRAEISKQITPSISVRFSPSDRFRSKERQEASTTPTTTEASNVSRENQIFPEAEPVARSSGRVRTPFRRRLGSRNRRIINLTRRRSKLLDGSQPPLNVGVPASRSLRKRMMGRKDIPELVIRQIRRRS